MNSEPTDQGRWFTEEVQVHESSLKGYLRGSFPWLQDVDDVIQESYMRLLRANGEGTVRSAKSFLFATARNIALDLFRRRRTFSPEAFTENDAVYVLEQEPSAAEVASLNQELAILAEAIRRLPERCRQVLTLRRIYGLSQKEIAVQLGITENTVEAQVGIGLRRCREYLRGHGVLMKGDDANE